MAAMTTANRTSGVAPLLVFFDAVDATAGGSGTTASPTTVAWSSGVYQPTDKLGALYEWNFGDPGSGTWTQTGLSRNTATGFTAAHVYDTPGTYTVVLTITDSDGVARPYDQSITVSAISGTTYYVAAAPTGNDSNNGTSQATPFATVAKGLSMAGANRSILFRRGDTWTGVSPQTVSASGPGIIGAYGTGARPIWVSTASNNSNTPSNSISLGGADWRAMDIEVRGTAWACIQANGTNGLFLRCFVNSSGGVFCGAGGGNTGAGFVENEIAGCSTYGAYVSGRQMAVMGNNVHDNVATGSHIWRAPVMHKGVISNNRFWMPGNTRHALKLHSDITSLGGSDTRYVTVSDNLIRGKTWPVSLGSQDAGTDERPHHIVYERNRHYGESSVTVDVLIHSSDVVARNNVLDATGSTDGYVGIWAVHWGNVTPMESNIRIYNNTVYSSGTANSNGIAAAAVGTWATSATSGPTNVTVKNNLLSAPNMGGFKTAVDVTGVIQGGAGPGAGYVASNNLVTNTPGFTNAAAGDFSLLAGSPAIGAGASLWEVRQDFLRLLRPAGAAYDIGAYEYGAVASWLTITADAPSGGFIRLHGSKPAGSTVGVYKRSP